MDPRRFDTLAKTLSTSGTRRGALAALLAGTLGLLGLPQTTQGRKRRGRGDVTIQGPCGDGSGPANLCTRPADCCTGICERSRPGKPKRCRCRHQGQACTQSRNCCKGAGQDLVCDGGTCQPASCTGLGLGQTCASPSDCCQDEPTDCMTNGCPLGNQVCCRQASQPCGSSCDCCGGLTCFGGGTCGI